jgi:CubicO group peptidase (beta-lactamase class C family)
MNRSTVRDLLTRSVGTTYPAAQLVIYRHGRVVFDEAVGWLDPDERRRPARASTRFDLASVSKLFVATAFMSMVERGRARLDQPARHVLPAFDGNRSIQPYPDPLRAGARIEAWPGGGIARAGDVTFRHLLSHTSGLPAWLPIWREVSGEDRTRQERERMFHDAITSTPFAYPTGARVLYSDLGLIVLGLAMERLAGRRLDDIVRECVVEPLGLRSAGYGPIECEDVAPTEFYTWRGRRMCGDVHDENAFALGGVAGHAGIFASARDVAAFGEAMRQCRIGASSVPLSEASLIDMTRLQAEDGDVRRGLGFALWSPHEAAMSHPLSPSSFGHLGFTGTSLWIDPERELTFACLTNRVYYGRDAEDTTTPFRLALSQAIAAGSTPSPTTRRATSARPRSRSA